MTTPDIVGTVRAYRTWRLGRLKAEDLTDSVFLMPITNKSPSAWLSREARALCIICRQDVPRFACTCGLYASTDPRSTAIPSFSKYVHGVIECSGGIVYMKKNHVIRAEKAHIVALSMPPSRFKKTTIAAVQSTYPWVRIFRSRREMIREYPPQETVPRRVTWNPRTWISPQFYPALPGMGANIGFFAVDPAAHWLNGAFIFLWPVLWGMGRGIIPTWKKI